MPKIMLADCSKIFLDTGIIIDLMNPSSNDERKKLVFALIEHLSKTKARNNRTRRFYLSTISISEISDIGKTRTFIGKLSNFLDVSNLELIPFDIDAALHVSNGFAGFIAKDVMNAYIRNAGFQLHEFSLAREWITRDMMIAATAKSVDADVVFTTERFQSENKTTFIGIAKKLDLFCVPTYKEYFQESHGNEPIMEFSDKSLRQVFEEKGKKGEGKL